MKFSGSDHIPDWYLKTVTVKAEGIHENSEIGDYIGQKNELGIWLTDLEIERIFECKRKLLVGGRETITSTGIYQKLLYEAGFEEMNPDIKYSGLFDCFSEHLSVCDKRRRSRIFEMAEINGDILYNDKRLICPICGHKYVAHNIYDADYPFVDSKMESEGIQPLTFSYRYSRHKYYCLNCGSHFGSMPELKEVFSFGRGAFFSGALEYTIWEMPDCMLFESSSANDFCDMRDYIFRFPKEDMKKLLAILKKTSRWKELYECKDEILDGYGWHITCNYNGMKVKTSGYEAFPYRFTNTIRTIQESIEDLCRKYANNYSDDRIKERLSL